MPNFITRVELQSASKKDYQKLVEEMKKASFKDVQADPARRTPAEPAEFNCNGNFTLLQVTDATAKAARKTGRRYSFTVIKERKMSVH